MERYISHSEAETVQIGTNLAARLQEGGVVALYGDLGAGKTALTKGIAAYFGVTETHSPTFTIVNEYYGDKTLYHFDAYRIGADDWLNGGFDEYLYAGGISVVEWAENVAAVLPKDCIAVRIDKRENEDEREIRIGESV
jgi:tRNA threonylcarbamoyladenosine biosynthesis protein TsaE